MEKNIEKQKACTAGEYFFKNLDRQIVILRRMADRECSVSAQIEISKEIRKLLKCVNEIALSCYVCKERDAQRRSDDAERKEDVPND